MKRRYVHDAAKLAVASELLRRDIRATIPETADDGTDLKVESGGKTVRIRVGGKQGHEWPGCKGIHGDDAILVLVDFQGKEHTERPDFYILNESDWLAVVNPMIEAGRGRGVQCHLDERNTPAFPDQPRGSDVYRGIGIKVANVLVFRGQWEKLQ